MTVIAAHYRAHTKTKTGIWRDLAVRRRKTEVGALLGATVAKARGFGLPMPLTERLIAIIEDLETGRRAMSWDNVDELVRIGFGATDHLGQATHAASRTQRRRYQ
jgi:2-dehydropantoate 2-reductase